MKTRAENIAFLTANCGVWKGKEKVLQNKEVFDDKTLADLVDNAEVSIAAANAVKTIRTDLGIPEETALNAMPAFIKDKIAAKADDPAPTGISQAEWDKMSADEKAAYKSKKNATTDPPTPPTTVNLDSLTPELLNALSVKMFGRPAADVRNGLDDHARAKAAEKVIVINQLVSVVPEDKRAARRTMLEKLSLNELYDRREMLVESGALTTSNTQRDSNDRLPVFGGRLVEGDSVQNADDVETFDLTVMNWDKSKAGATV